jgi:hypothetical protein
LTVLSGGLYGISTFAIRRLYSTPGMAQVLQLRYRFWQKDSKIIEVDSGSVGRPRSWASGVDSPPQICKCVSTSVDLRDHGADRRLCYVMSVARMLQIHIYPPPSRPNSVLKISSHPPPLCRSLGFENVRDDVARPFLFGWPGASDCDQGCWAARMTLATTPARPWSRRSPKKISMDMPGPGETRDGVQDIFSTVQGRVIGMMAAVLRRWRSSG